MRPNRLGLLLCALVLVAGVRFMLPPPADDFESAAVAVPVPREERMRHSVALNDQRPARTVAAKNDEDDAESDAPGNAFAVRLPPPPVLPPPPPTAMQMAVVSPVPPPTPVVVPPPLQIVGTYDDGTAPGVFVATTGGTLLARSGTVLLSDYKVTAITPQQLTVLQLSTQKSTSFPIVGRATP